MAIVTRHGPLNTLTYMEASMPTSYRPTADYLRQCFREEDGRLFWRERPQDHFNTLRGFLSYNSRRPGREAGYCSVGPDDYFRWMINFDGHMIMRHRIVWAIHHGEWADRLDHHDGNSLNDRIDNLRIATQSQNLANARLKSNNTSGIKGVWWNRRRQKWEAQIKVDRRKIYLGLFEDIEEARRVRVEAARKYHGEFFRES